MNTYIEVAWLVNFAIGVSAHIVASSVITQVINLKKIVLVSAIAFLITTLFFEIIGLILITEIVQGVLIYKRNIKAMLQMQLARCFYLSLGIIWTKGISKNFILFVEDVNFSWISFILFLVVLSFIIKIIVIPKINQYRFEMDVLMDIDDQVLNLRGFLDSGNTLCHHQIPVLFLNDDYKPYINEEKAVELRYLTVDKESVCRVYPCKIKIENSWKKAYFTTSEHVKKPIDCLLNSRLYC